MCGCELHQNSYLCSLTLHDVNHKVFTIFFMNYVASIMVNWGTAEFVFVHPKLLKWVGKDSVLVVKFCCQFLYFIYSFIFFNLYCSIETWSALPCRLFSGATFPRLSLLVLLSFAVRKRVPTVIGPSYFSITPAMNDSGATVFVANTHSFFITALSWKPLLRFPH